MSASPKAAAPAVKHVPVPARKLAPEDNIMYGVRDKNAVSAARVHELVDARGFLQPYTFPNANTYVDVPMSLAVRLIGNDGFEVVNERGLEMRAVNTNNKQEIILSYNQVVATLDELTHEALLVRAKKAGGKYTKATGKDELISYLVEVALNTPSEEVDHTDSTGDFDLEMNEDLDLETAGEEETV